MTFCFERLGMVLSDWGVFAQRYKYMRIYLWSALRTMVLRMVDLRWGFFITAENPSTTLTPRLRSLRQAQCKQDRIRSGQERGVSVVSGAGVGGISSPLFCCRPPEEPGRVYVGQYVFKRISRFLRLQAVCH